MRLSRDARNYLLFGTMLFVVLEALLAVAIIWWPSFAENTGALKRLAAPLPMLADQLNLIDMIGVPAYVVAQHFFKGCNTLGAAAAVLLAMNAVAGEAQRGTMELWLSRPVTRRRLFTERYLGGLAAVCVPVMLTTLTIPALLTLVDETMGYGHLILCALHQCLFLGALYSLTLWLSALGSQPLKIGFVMMFACIGEFALYMVKTLTHYSVFRLVDIEAFARVLSTSALDPVLSGSLLAVNVVAYLGGLVALERRVP